MNATYQLVTPLIGLIALIVGSSCSQDRSGDGGVAIDGGESSMSISDLRCEMQPNPLGVDTNRPRLSWILSDPQTRGQRQIAYRVLVASSIERLREGRGDLWDSGKVAAEDSIHVEYGGEPLRAGQQVFWTVRVWDREGQATAWAKPAWWTMGLLEPRDWRAKWIGQTPQASPPQKQIERAKWIWFRERGVASSPGTAAASRKPLDAPPGTRYFRKAFTLPAGKTIQSATLVAAVDNESRMQLNGQDAGQTDQWETASSFDVAKLLKPGAQNVLTVTARNTTSKPSPAGVVACLVVRFDDGTSLEVLTDESWEAAQTEKGQWGSAIVQAKWGEGPWHTASSRPQPPLPLFRKSFELAKPVKRAIVHVSGLGHYKLLVNGQPARATVLDPPWSKYEKTAYYDTLDIAPLLRQGRNAFGVILAKGFYTTEGDRRVNHNHADRPLTVRLQAHVEYEDDSIETIASDDSWRWAAGPYTHNAILGGPSYDARLLPNGWADPDFDDSSWKSATAIDPGVGALRRSESPPLRLYEQFKPKLIDEPEPGRFVYDFGQNASATVRLIVTGPAGATIRLTYAEQRHGATPHRNDGKGPVNQSGIRSPNYIEYTCRGDPAGETWLCDLFYSGFQYIELTGGVPQGRANPHGKPVVNELTSIHVRSSAEPIGRSWTGNAMYKQIDRMIDWSVRSNLSHVLTDCPHREKMGWLEVPHLMWPSIAGRYDLSRFGPKICRDIRDSQLPGGEIPTVAPSYAVFPGPFQYTPEWGAAGVFIPWYVYQWYGDRRALEESYDSMRRFVDFLRETADADLVPKAGLGDWYDYGHGHPMGPSRFTPVELSAMATFYDCANVAARSADLLGRGDETKRYRELAKQIAAGFEKRFYEGKGQYRNNGSPQTANAMALVTGLVDAVDPSRRQTVVDTIIADLEKRGWQQTAGDVGFHYLVRALADNGRSDALYRICNRDDLGSYGFLVNAGWTSLPESWDANGSYSLNHCMLGHIQEWFMQDVAGIAPARDATAFKSILIRPTPGPGVTSASGTYQSPYGPISTSWSLLEDGKKFTLDLKVPVNTSAQVRIPGAWAADVKESGMEASRAPGVEFVRLEQEGVIFKVGSGQYRFEADIRPAPTVK